MHFCAQGYSTSMTPENHIRSQVTALVAATSQNEASRRLGIPREAVAKLVRGESVRKGTLLCAAAGLERLVLTQAAR